MPRTHSTAKHNKILDFLRIAVVSGGIIQWLTGRFVPLPRSASRRAYSALLTNGFSSGGGWTEEEAGNSQHHRVRGERVTDFNPITLRRDAGGGGMGVGPFSLYLESRCTEGALFVELWMFGKDINACARVRVLWSQNRLNQEKPRGTKRNLKTND